MSTLEDLRRNMEVASNSTSPFWEAWLKFQSSKKIKWLENFSNKTNWNYGYWHDICKRLLHYRVIPTLKELNWLNRYSLERNINPGDFLGDGLSDWELRNYG